MSRQTRGLSTGSRPVPHTGSVTPRIRRAIVSGVLIALLAVIAIAALWQQFG